MTEANEVSEWNIGIRGQNRLQCLDQLKRADVDEQMSEKIVVHGSDWRKIMIFFHFALQQGCYNKGLRNHDD